MIRTAAYLAEYGRESSWRIDLRILPVTCDRTVPQATRNRVRRRRHENIVASSSRSFLFRGVGPSNY